VEEHSDMKCKWNLDGSHHLTLPDTFSSATKVPKNSGKKL